MFGSSCSSVTIVVPRSDDPCSTGATLTIGIALSMPGYRALSSPRSILSARSTARLCAGPLIPFGSRCTMTISVATGKPKSATDRFAASMAFEPGGATPIGCDWFSETAGSETYAAMHTATAAARTRNRNGPATSSARARESIGYPLKSQRLRVGDYLAVCRCNRPGHDHPPRVDDKLAHLFRLDCLQPREHPVIPHVCRARLHELVRRSADQPLSLLFRKCEAHRLVVARERQVDDAADAEFDPAANQHFVAARKRLVQRAQGLACGRQSV